MTILNTLQQFFEKHGANKNYLIGYSGGLDSHVLLAAAIELREKLSLNISVIHINHGLSANAKQWQTHCERICHQLSVPFIKRTIKLQIDTGDSVEEIARNGRYTAIKSLLTANDIFLTAHHQDDQAETFMLQLLRGAGTKGLSAMPVIKVLGLGCHARPLLIHSREEFVDYAKIQKLDYIQDDSNNDTRFSRNFLRIQILPLLKNRWPRVSATIARSSQYIQETESLIEEYLQYDLNTLKGLHDNTLSIKKLNQFSLEKQKLLLRMWIQQAGFLQPNAKKLMSIIKNVMACQADKTPLVNWQNVEIRRYRDDLFLLEARQKPIIKTLDWHLSESILLPCLGQLSVTKKTGGLSPAITSLNIRFRQGGEVTRFRKKQRHSLKNLFQTWGVPPWERDRIPLLYLENELIAAVGFFIAPHVCVKADEVGYDFVLVNDPLSLGGLSE